MQTARTIPFHPLPLFAGPHAQTILGSTLVFPGGSPSVRKLVQLEDGDQLALEISTPPGWPPVGPTVVMVHGLCGSHRSACLVRMTRKFRRRGIRVVRVNLRGCGSGRGLARNLYHSGRSDDIRAVLECLHDETPASPLALIGFSLGGNIALKLAAELGPDAGALLRQVIAVCPPTDLLACSRRLSQPQNRLYDRHFMSVLRADIALRHRRFPDLSPHGLPRRLTLFEFDDVYTAPRSGFRDALDYYARCSSAPLLPRIEIPCTVLVANDDPVIDSTVLLDMSLPTTVEVVHVPRGGHLGFLGMPGSRGGYRWMDRQLLAWIDEGLVSTSTGSPCSI